METDDKTDTDVAKGPAKKLGLSKTVYALGMSARDSLVTFAAATAALFPAMYYGQKYKVGFVEKLAAVPDKVHSFVTAKLGDRAGPFGKSLAVAASLATLIGYAAHVPGLFRGPKKVKDAEDKFNAEVADNQKLATEVKKLAQTVERQGMELTDVKMQNPSFADKLKSQQAANDAPAVEMTNAEKVIARRTAASESTVQQTA